MADPQTQTPRVWRILRAPAPRWVRKSLSAACFVGAGFHLGGGRWEWAAALLLFGALWGFDA